MKFKKFGALLLSAVLCIGMAAPALRSLRTFSPSTFKSEFGIIVHLNSIVSFW